MLLYNATCIAAHSTLERATAREIRLSDVDQTLAWPHSKTDYVLYALIQNFRLFPMCDTIAHRQPTANSQSRHVT